MVNMQWLTSNTHRARWMAQINGGRSYIRKIRLLLGLLRVLLSLHKQGLAAFLLQALFILLATTDVL